MSRLAVENPIKIYYKNTGVPNGTLVGSPTISNGILSNCTKTSYLLTPSPLRPGDGTWEFHTKVTVGPSTGYSQGILGRVHHNFYGINLNLGGEGKLQLWLSSEVSEGNDIAMGRRWWNPSESKWEVTTDRDYAKDGVSVFVEGDIIEIKVKFNGGNYSVWSKKEGLTVWTEEISINDTKLVYTNPEWAQGIGWNHAGEEDTSQIYEVWTGSIDLNETYVKINGIMSWRALLYETSNQYNYDYMEDFTSYAVVKSSNRIYYKYNVTNWTNPIMTEDVELGGDAFAIKASEVYTTGREPFHMFGDDSIVSYYTSTANGAVNGVDFYIYSPIPVCITSLYYKLYGNAFNLPEEGYFKGSNNNSTWTDIDNYSISHVSGLTKFNISIDNIEYYQYYIWHVSSSCSYGTINGDARHFLTISDAKLEGTSKIITSGTENNYDYYKDVLTYSAFIGE